MEIFQKLIKLWKAIDDLPARTQTILAITLGLIIIFIGSINFLKLWNNHRWTVATTIRKEDHGYVRYIFKVDEVIFEARKKGIGLRPDSVRYWVRFYPDDPSLCDIVYNDEVPECIKLVPSKGWKEIPKCR
jgi:hypothetical protein